VIWDKRIKSLFTECIRIFKQIKKEKATKRTQTRFVAFSFLFM